MSVVDCDSRGETRNDSIGDELNLGRLTNAGGVAPSGLSVAKDESVCSFIVTVNIAEHVRRSGGACATRTYARSRHTTRRMNTIKFWHGCKSGFYDET